VTELQAHLRSPLSVGEVHDAGQRGLLVSFHRPGQPGVMRPSGVGLVISTITSAAPPTARAPRCIRCQSPTTPSCALYCAIGETTMRFFSVHSRTFSGSSMGGVGLPPTLRPPALSCSQLS
jgi:hypothetical protein